MKLRNLCTKRKLKEKNENLSTDVRYFRNALENERLNHALDKSTLKQCQQENKRLWAIIAALTDKYSDKDKHSGFECVGVD